MGGRVEGEFFDTLPEATDDSEDALRHGGCDVENCVQVVRHEAVLEQFDLGVSLGDLGEVVNDGFAEFGALHVGLHGVVVGDDEFAQQGFAGGYHKDHVVDADAAPSAAVLLPMPSVHDYLLVLLGAMMILLPFASSPSSSFIISLLSSMMVVNAVLTGRFTSSSRYQYSLSRHIFSRSKTTFS